MATVNPLVNVKYKNISWNHPCKTLLFFRGEEIKKRLNLPTDQGPLQIGFHPIVHYWKGSWTYTVCVSTRWHGWENAMSKLYTLTWPRPINRSGCVRFSSKLTLFHLIMVAFFENAFLSTTDFPKNLGKFVIKNSCCNSVLGNQVGRWKY